MRYEFHSVEEGIHAAYRDRGEAMAALCHSRSVTAELLAIPESLADFIELCQDKYGKNIKFCLIAEVEDPHDYIYWGPREKSVSELHESIGNLHTNRRTYLEEVHPMVEGSPKEKYILYSDYPETVVQPEFPI